MKKQKQKIQSHHRPVLLDKTLELLSPAKSESYLDLTAGYGGHAREIIGATGSPDKAVLVDRDIQAIEALKEITFPGPGRPQICHNDYLSAVQELGRQQRRFDIVLMDLGLSTPQLAQANRGFSFQAEGPLDMRMDASQTLTANQLVNALSQDELSRIIRSHGDEPKADSIARTIINARPIESTRQLAEIISKTKGRRGRIHPATRTFQAIRIAVNDELDQLSKALPMVLQLLNPGARWAVISFHSLEDKLVKNYFREHSRSGYEASLELRTKPIRGKTEDASNPRARSAILRVAQRK